MEAEDSKRQIVKIVSEICAENGIRLTKYLYGWILGLEKDGKTFHIVGYTFPNNDAAARELCNDKAGLYAVLKERGIAAVEHFLFMSPDNLRFVGADGNWAGLTGLLKKYGRLVLKDNGGSGGDDCYLINGVKDLEYAAHRLFNTRRAIAASPFYKIENEYRLIVLNGAVELAYVKERASVTGDGVKSAAALIDAKYGGVVETDAVLDKARVPAAGETVYLTWKHNLCRGASARVLENSPLKEKSVKTALSAAEAAGVKFGSVDIIFTGDKPLVLEINAGVMAEAFAARGGEFYKTAKSIYKKAIDALFSDGAKP